MIFVIPGKVFANRLRLRLFTPRHFAVWICYKVAHKKLTVEITFLVNVLYFLSMVQNISLLPPYKVFASLLIKYFPSSLYRIFLPPYKVFPFLLIYRIFLPPYKVVPSFLIKYLPPPSIQNVIYPCRTATPPYLLGNILVKRSNMAFIPPFGGKR